MRHKALRVLLVDPPDYTGIKSLNIQLPLGLIALKNYIDQNLAQTALKIEVCIMDFTLELAKAKSGQNLDLDVLMDQSGVLNQAWDLIGLTTHFTNTLCSIQIAEKLKEKNPDALVVFGGVHASSCSQSLLDFAPVVDLIVQGEGEMAFWEICQLLGQGQASPEKLQAIPNIFSRLGANPRKSFLKLQEVSPSDYGCVDLSGYRSLSKVDSFWIESGRGCVFKCGFCISSKHWGYRSRTFSTHRLVSDMRSLKNAGIHKVKFTHDLFTVRMDYVRELCQEIIAEDLNMEWGCYSRVDQFPCDEDLALMARAGCTSVFVGVESRIVDVQGGLRKASPSEQLEAVMDSCERHGVELETNMILGFPQHEEYQLLEELQFCVELKKRCFNRLSITPLELYPSTPYYLDPSYKSLFVMSRSGMSSAYQDLFSFQFELKKRFWGLHAQTVAELFRNLSTYFPETIRVTLSHPKGMDQLSTWISTHAHLLNRLNSEARFENVEIISRLLRKDLSLFEALRQEIGSAIVLESAIAMVTVGLPDHITWSSESLELQHTPGRAVVKSRSLINKDGMIRDFNAHWLKYTIVENGSEIDIEAQEVS